MKARPFIFFAIVGATIITTAHVLRDGIDMESTTAMFMIVFAFGLLIGRESK